jgi:hypothetical protein
LKKIICLLLVIAFISSGCALAAGMAAGTIASEVIKRTTGIFKGDDEKKEPQHQDLLRDRNVLEMK